MRHRGGAAQPDEAPLRASWLNEYLGAGTALSQRGAEPTQSNKVCDIAPHQRRPALGRVPWLFLSLGGGSLQRTELAQHKDARARGVGVHKTMFAGQRVSFCWRAVCVMNDTSDSECSVQSSVVSVYYVLR